MAADDVGDDFYCDVALVDPTRPDVVVDTGSVLAHHHTRPAARSTVRPGC